MRFGILLVAAAALVIATPAHAQSVYGKSQAGIGTSGPLSALDVVGGAAIGAGYAGVTAAPANGAIIQGSVGIGTTGPVSMLNVASANTTDFVRFGTPATNATNLTFGFSSLNNGAAYLQGSIYAVGLASLNLNPNGGNVGIGTTNPALAPLQTQGAVGNTAAVFGSGTTGISIVSNYPQIAFNGYYNGGWYSLAAGYGGVVVLNEGDGSLDFDIAPRVSGGGLAQTMSERMRITNGGYVGIGTSSPNASLHIYNSTAFNPGSQPYANNQIEFGNISMTGFIANGMAFANSNGSGTSGFGLLAEANDVMYFGHTSGTSGSVSMQINAAGTLTVSGATTCTIGNGTGATNCTSDRRLKQTIRPIDHALDKLLRITGVTFHWKDPAKAGPEHIGVIAQDVEQVFPQAVGSVENKELGTAKTVDIAALVAPMIEAIRELKAENDALAERVAALEAAGR